MLESLSVCTGIDEFKPLFFRCLNPLILDVGLNLIKTTENERQLMLDNPREFVSLALDTCDKQKSRVVKTQAAKLFESLSDNIDGAVTLTSYFTIQAINLTLAKETESEPVDVS